MAYRIAWATHLFIYLSPRSREKIEVTAPRIIGAIQELLATGAFWIALRDLAGGQQP